MTSPAATQTLAAEYAAIGLKWPVKPTPKPAEPIVRRTEPGQPEHNE